MYGKVFEALAEEDYVFMDDREEDEEFPKFGGPDADYDEVRNLLVDSLSVNMVTILLLTGFCVLLLLV